MASTPEGFATITPTLVVPDAVKALELYSRALGAKEVHKMLSPDGKVMHACLQIGNSRFFVAEADPQKGANPTDSGFYVYVDDVDAAFRQARQAGFKEASPVEDQFWGDRSGCVFDTAGNRWMLATHKRDISPQEIQKAAAKASSKAA